MKNADWADWAAAKSRGSESNVSWVWGGWKRRMAWMGCACLARKPGCLIEGKSSLFRLPNMAFSSGLQAGES